MSNLLCESVLDVDTEASIAPDHKAVKLCLQFNYYKRGAVLWKFNNSFQEDDEVVSLINDNYPIIIDKYRQVYDKRLL